MKVTIQKGKANGKVIAPPSKSFAHRQLICSALSGVKCSVKGVIDSQDMLATLDCLNALGYSYIRSDDSVDFLGRTARTTNVFNCRESGSTLRFIIPVALCFLDSATFYGSQKLISRGVEIYKQILGEKGIKVSAENHCVKTQGKLKAGSYKIQGNVSSQFISGMLFALPMLEGDSTIEIIPPIESASYVNITLQVLKNFGIKIEQVRPNVYFVKGNQKYQGVDTIVEGDWSNAAFLYALEKLDNNVSVLGLNESSVQGDKVCVSILDALKQNIKTDIDLSDCPDLAPVLFAFASANGGGVFTGTKRLAIKESDRAKAMQLELAKFGIQVDVLDNKVIVHNGKLKTPTQTLFGHNDHRIVMSLAVLCTLTGGIIDDAQAIEKSYPSFFSDLQDLQIKVCYER